MSVLPSEQQLRRAFAALLAAFCQLSRECLHRSHLTVVAITIRTQRHASHDVGLALGGAASAPRAVYGSHH